MVERVVIEGDVTNHEAPNSTVDTGASQVTEGSTSDRPSWLPQNFNSPEDFAKSYQEAQAELTRTKQELSTFKKTPEDTNQEQPPQNPNDLQITEEQAKAVQSQDFTVFQDEFVKTGDVAPESREKLAEQLKSVFGDNAKQVIDDYIEGQKVRAVSYRNSVTSVVGGEQQYQALVQWAAKSLPPGEIAAFNSVVDSGDFNQVKLAVAGLNAQYQAINGRSPNLVNGEGGKTYTAGYSSKFDMMKDMSDPRYGKDAAFTRSVEQKVAGSTF